MNFLIFGYAAYIPIYAQVENRIINTMITPSGTKIEARLNVKRIRTTIPRNMTKFRPKPRSEKIAAFLMIFGRLRSNVTMIVYI